IHKTAVIGAGVMGAGLAQWLSKCGFPVLLKDIDRTRVASGMRMIHRLFREAKRYGILTQQEASRCLDVITPVTQDVPLHLIDLVIEAAVESLEVKKRIFAGLSEKASPETILATNTSALSVTALAEAPGVTHPERVIGIHFFNPVSRMKLVEVVVTPYTSPKVVERVLGFVRAIGKIPIVVKDSPGFLVNRILMPYLIGAGNLVDQGHDPEVVDEAMLDFGMPMGPLRLLDEIGLDVAEHVVTTMIEAFGERFESPRLLKEMVDEGNLGKKTGSGFYRYVGGKTETISRFRKQKDSLTCQEISRHLAGLMTDESVRCLEEGLVEKADQIDLAMILGTGFAPFRGGPMRWARGLGNPHE
ncbi:MAG: 3-hydroxyacyl-CoA dehydrogenase family protein, partial [Verrucomicrobiota bacterium]